MLRAEAGAARAGAVRRVEGEDPRLQLRHRGAAARGRRTSPRRRACRPTRARALRRRVRRAACALRRPPAAVLAPVSTSTMPSASATAVSTESASRLRASGFICEPVHDHRDVVLVLLVELDLVLEQAQLAVDLRAREALGAQLLEQVLVLALAAPHDRRQHHEAGALVERHHVVDDLLDRLARDRRAAVVAVRMADPRPQQAQVVVDLGDGPDRRARVPRGRLLVDRDRRREALDRVDVGLVHLAQELARVGRQRLDVAALALGVDRVEGKARLAGPGEPGDDDQGVARQLEGDVLEVVLARARDADAVVGGHLIQLYGGRGQAPRNGASLRAPRRTPVQRHPALDALQLPGARRRPGIAVGGRVPRPPRSPARCPGGATPVTRLARFTGGPYQSPSRLTARPAATPARSCGNVLPCLSPRSTRSSDRVEQRLRGRATTNITASRSSSRAASGGVAVLQRQLGQARARARPARPAPPARRAA